LIQQHTEETLKDKVMKRLIVLGLFGVMGWMPYQATAQVSINVNIGSQPLWGPVGYDYVDSYYLPDIESYYSVPRRQFIYLQGSRWIFSASLPSRYRGYDLYNGYKVVVSRDGYRNFNRDRVTYSRYRNVRSQPVIRYSRDARYHVVKGHPHGMPPGQAKKYESRGHDRGGNWGRNDKRGNDSRGHDRGDRGRGKH
jgi:hypothetical protein